MLLWAAANARGRVDPVTMMSSVVGPLLWQYVGKQQAAKYKQKITATQIGDDLVNAAAGTPGAFSDIEGALEDNLSLFLLARPGTYLAVQYLMGTFAGGKRLSLPEYLVISAAGAGTGSLIRQMA